MIKHSFPYHNMKTSWKHISTNFHKKTSKTLCLCQSATIPQKFHSWVRNWLMSKSSKPSSTMISKLFVVCILLGRTNCCTIIKGHVLRKCMCKILNWNLMKVKVRSRKIRRKINTQSYKIISNLSWCMRKQYLRSSINWKKNQVKLKFIRKSPLMKLRIHHRILKTKHFKRKKYLLIAFFQTLSSTLLTLLGFKR